MTPRALLTAIGATAIAFAVVIGGAAGSGMMNRASSATMTPMAQTSQADAPRIERYRWDEPAAFSMMDASGRAADALCTIIM